LRTLLIGVLAATLVGCSRQPSPQAAIDSCTSTNGLSCLERKAGPPINLMSLRTHSAATNSRSAGAWKNERSSAPARHGTRLASATAKSADSAAAAESPAARTDIAQSHPTIGAANSNVRTIEAQVAAATMLAERLTSAAATPDTKANGKDRSGRPETLARGDAERSASAPVNDTLVAVLMARPDIRSVSDLTGKTIAIDDRYSASNGIVRTAIVAAGAPEVQLSEGHTTAIDRLANGEVPAAVLALVSADAAEGFPEIAGFRIFHIPLSPRSLKGRP